jgi:prepilin-type N-terminal cleavage/methylation domain-containing protein
MKHAKVRMQNAEPGQGRCGVSSPGSAFCIHRSAFPRARGFTLVECLATMLLMAIILPAVDQGIAAATLSAGTTRHRTEAAGLAQSKLSELIVSGSAVWSAGKLSGDFGSDWPEYKWNATVSPWVNDTQSVGLEQMDVQVTWTDRNQQMSFTVSSLVYTRPVP